MKAGPRGSLVWALVLGLFVLTLVVAARALPDQVRIVPTMVGIPTLGFLLLLLAGEFYPPVIRWTESTLEDLWGGGPLSKEDAAEGARGAPAEEEPSWPAVLRMMSYAVGFLVLVIVFGFFLVPPLFVATFLFFEAKVRALYAILAGVIANLALYGGMVFLKVDIWTGLVPEIVEGYIGGSIMPPL